MVKIRQFQKKFYPKFRQNYFQIPFLKPKNKYKKPLLFNSIYIYNLPENILHDDILYKYEFLGQYGNIIKINIYNDYCFVKFSSEYEAALSLLSLYNSIIYSNLIKVGFQRRGFNNDKSDFQISIEKTDLFKENIKKKLMQRSLDKRTIFPSPYEIYNKTEFIEYQIKMGYFNKNDNIFKFKEVEKSRFNFDIMTSNTEEEKNEKESINDFDEINTLIMKEIKSNI